MSEEAVRKYIEYVKEKSKYGFNPITALDYSSLYPSLIMTYNLSPEYLIKDSNYKDILKEKYRIHDIEFTYNYKDYLDNEMSKIINGWTVRHENGKRFGLYPEILQNLFNQRAEMKKSLEIYKEKKEHMEKEYEGKKEELQLNREYQECLFQLKYADTKQKALKVYMNCFYGELGNKNSPLFILELAGGITSAGQMNLRKVKKYIENNKCKTYYGDSVVGETPIIIKKQVEDVIAIEDLFNQYLKNVYTDKITQTKEIIDTSELYINVMTETGWTKINKIIRHKTNKKLYRVKTLYGCVTVTEDHSLLNKNKEKIKPSECVVGTQLLHWNYKLESHIKIKETDSYLVKKQKEWVNSNSSIDLSYKNTQIISIKYVGTSKAFVYDLETESHHFAAGVGQIVVHNTDSLYFTFDNELFIDVHKQYLISSKDQNVKKIDKKEYSSMLVERTFSLVKELSGRVNKFLMNDNGTKYLKMAYEEVLFPAVFLSRKKYYGIAHEKVVNFKPKELFIRGLEVKKRGVSEILRIICLETMWKSMDIYNNLNLRQLVFNKIDFLFSKEWFMDDFTQTALWKPNKKNQTLITYVNRMLADGRDPPNPYERFNYVIVKITDPCRLYDFKGRKIDIKKGDKMEYIQYAKDNSLEIDLNYYFEKQLIGQFARLISYDEEFHSFKIGSSNSEFLEENELEILDDKTMNNCKKYIKEYSKKYTGIEKIGEVYKKVYRTINSLVNQSRKDLCKNKKKLEIMFNYQEEYLGVKTCINQDVRPIIMEKVNTFINMTAIKKSIQIEIKNSYDSMKNSNVNITKMFNKKKNSFLDKLIETHDKNLEKTVMEFIKFTRDNKIDNIIFNTGEQNISPIMKKIQTENMNIYSLGEEDLDHKIKEIYNTSIKKNNDIDDKSKILEESYNKFINIVSIVKSKKIVEGIMELNLLTVEKSVRVDYTKGIKGFRL